MHTVGPCVGGMLTPQHCTALAQCCRSCLQLMPDSKLKTIAFCCISTGVFRFPKDKAAAIALREVRLSGRCIRKSPCSLTCSRRRTLRSTGLC